MDLILLKDVDKLGKEGAVVHVKPGFARNYLVPRGLALPATAQYRRAAEEKARQSQAKRDRLRAQADALKQKLEGTSLTLKLKVGEGDATFGSITVNDLQEALAAAGITVEKHAITLDQPIKALGIYEVPVRLHPEVTGTVKVWITKA